MIELIVSVGILGVMMVAILNFFLVQNRTHMQQDVIVAREENLRLAADIVTDVLRNTGSGAPVNSSLLPLWVSWVSGFNQNPMIVAGANATTPDTISVAACFEESVAVLAVNAVQGSNTLVLNPTDPTLQLSTLIDTNRRGLIRIGDWEFARMRSITGNVVTIDTNPGTPSTNDGVGRAYASGTPICRVDVVTLSVQSATAQLLRDENQGAGPAVAAEGITNLKIAGVGGQYQVTVTARTERRDPVSGMFPADQFRTQVSLRN